MPHIGYTVQVTATHIPSCTFTFNKFFYDTGGFFFLSNGGLHCNCTDISAF